MASPIIDRSPGLSTRDATDPQTVPALVRRSASVYTGSALRFWRDGRLRDFSYAELGTAVQEIARGLIALDVQPGDRFAILDRDLTQETGELTPTQKAKRAVVYAKFKDVIDALYQ